MYPLLSVSSKFVESKTLNHPFEFVIHTLANSLNLTKCKLELVAPTKL